MSNGGYWSGVLVRTGPGSYEVRFPTKRAANKGKPIRRSQVGRMTRVRELAAAKQEGDLPASKKWYLSASRTQVVDGTGAVVSSEVYVVKEAVVSNRKKIFLRFLYDNVVWIGYTLSTEPNRLKAKPSKATDLYATKAKRARRFCADCNRTVISKTRTLCPRCEADRDKVPCANPNCTRRVCSDRSKNKTGFCRVCVKKVNPYGVFVPPTNYPKKGKQHDAK